MTESGSGIDASIHACVASQGLPLWSIESAPYGVLRIETTNALVRRTTNAVVRQPPVRYIWGSWFKIKAVILARYRKFCFHSNVNQGKVHTLYSVSYGG